MQLTTNSLLTAKIELAKVELYICNIGNVIRNPYTSQSDCLPYFCIG